MYEINKKIKTKNQYRQKLFDEFIHFGYTKARIREYRFLREKEIDLYGNKKYTKVDLKNEFKELFTAVTLLAFIRGKQFDITVLGEGCGYFAAELFEYRLCNIISKAIKCSDNGRVSAIFLITDKKVRLTLFYKGQPISNIKEYAFQYSLNENVIINYSVEYLPVKEGKFKPAWEWLGDRLSDLNVALVADV